MKLRVKVGLIIGLIILSLSAGLYAILSRITLSGYAHLEDESIRRDIKRVINALSNELDQLNSIAGDWANWNDTYTFARDHNQGYIDNNLNDADLANIGVNLVLILDTSGQIVFEKALDIDTSIHPLPLPHGLEAYISAQSPLLSPPEPGQGRTGFLLLLEGPMLVSAWPILPSNREGLSTGTLILGRFLHAPVINRLLTDTETSLTVTRYNADQMPGDIQAPLVALMQGQEIVVRILSMDTIAAYSLVKDINGYPAAVLRIYGGRDIYNHGKLMLEYVLLALALVGLVLGVVTMAGMERFVLNPLAHLAHEVTQIGDTQDFSGRVSVTGTDEIGELAGKTNQMLTRILESEERYRQLVTQAHEGIMSIDLQDCISFANSSMAKMLGYSIDELQGKPFQSLMDEHNASIAAQILERCGQGISERYDLTFLHIEGHPVITNLSATPIKDEGGDIQGSFAIIENTTERMQAIAQTNRTLSLLQSSLESTADGLLIVDLAGKVVLYNQRFARMWQIPQDILDTGDDAKVLAYVTDQLKDPQAFIQKVQELYTQTEAESYDLVEFKDGRIFERYSAPQYMQGKAVGLVRSFRDITERKQAEEALRESEERYRSLFDSMLDGIYRSTHAGKFVDVNPAMVKMFGFSSKEEMLEVDIINELYFAPEERRPVLDAGQEMIEIYRMRRKDGSEIWVEDHGHYVHDEQGGVIYHEGILRDITERKRAEEALHESEEHYRTLFNETLDGICLADAETGLIIDCNQALAALVGREQAELIGQPQKILHPPYDEKEIYSPTFRQHRTDKEGQILETQVVTKTGIIRKVEIKANLLNIQGRQMLQGIFRDITERKQAEETLKKQQQELQIILDSVPANIWYKDKNNKYLQVNKATAAMMNMSVEEIKGKSPYDLFPDEADRIYIDSDMEVINTGQPKLGVIEKLHLPGGEIKWFRTDKVPYRDERGDITGMIILDVDITERRKAEEALRQSEERFRTLVENIPGEVYRCLPKPPWQTIQTSTEIQTLIGYPISDFLNGSLFYSSFILAEDLEMVDKALERSIVSKEPFIVEYRIHHADGSIHWVEEKGRAVYSEQGEPQWIDGIIFDITERKQAEQGLLESEERYRLVTDNTADAIWLTDMNLKTIYTSPSAVKMRGFTLEELNAMTLDQHMTPASLNIVLQALSEELTPEKLGQPDLQISRTMELEYYRKDGSVFWSECTFTLVRDGVGNPIGVLGVGRDITERKRVEEALRDSEARFRTLIEEASIAISIARSGRIIYSNPKYAQMFGYQSAEELNGRFSSDLYTPQSRKEIKGIIRRRAQGKPVPNEYEVVGQRKDGTRFNVHVSVANVELADGPANIGFLTDITERKRVENLRTSLYGVSEVAHKVHNLDALFRSLHAIVGELLPAKNFFISLYDPISDILSYPYFVDEYDPEPPPPRKFGRGLTEYVLRTGEPLLASPEVFGELVAKGDVESIGAASLDWLGVPLKTQDKVIGVLAVQSYTEGVRFNEAHQDILLFVSSQIAMAIERVAAEEAVRVSEERLRKFMDSADEIFALLDSKLNIVDFNLSAEKHFGFVKEKDIGKNLLEYAPSIKETGQFDELLDVLRTGKPVAYDDLLIPQMFEDRIIAMDAFVVGDGLGVIMRDITEQKMAEMRLHYAATHDSLTGLPNRALFQDRLDHAISLARRNNEKVAVMFVDLDSFKAVNDKYGHAAGDLLLTAIAERLVTYLRKSDTVSRLGGDEYTILVENFDGEEKLAALVEKIQAGIAKSFWIDEQEIKITASVGISYYPKDDEDSEGLLQKADAAMYRSKQRSNNSYQFYS